MFCALLTSRYQVSVYRTNGPLVIVISMFMASVKNKINEEKKNPLNEAVLTSTHNLCFRAKIMYPLYTRVLQYKSWM